MKSESLVIADQHAAVNMFLSLTHRPSSHESREHPKSLIQLAREEGAEGELDDWG